MPTASTEVPTLSIVGPDSWLTTATVAPPPAAVRKKFRLAPFYQKHVDVLGIPVVGSSRVLDAALIEAGYLALRMLLNRPDVAKKLAKRGVRIAVMATSERTRDIPEHSDLDPMFDTRARGLGATPHRPASSCGEENLLECPNDPYRAESIFIHEFAHTIHTMGLNALDSKFDKRVRNAYDRAMAQQLWSNTYARTDHLEYWAEGVQSYFACNNRTVDASHNGINSAAELAAYDPGLFALIHAGLGGVSWDFVPPTQRVHQPHLAALDRATLPVFQW
jgi:hypothetical protein